jgi:hypothetical protein
MNTAMRTLFTCASVFAGVLTWNSSALAVTPITNPHGANVAVTVVVVELSTGHQAALYQRKDNGFCLLGHGPSGIQVTLGGPTGLDGDYEVHGGSGADTLSIPNSSGFTCGLSYIPLKFNGHFLDLRGLGGNDLLVNFMTDDTWLFLDEGDDQGVNYSPGRATLGGTGADQVYSFSSGGGEILEGHQGADCLCDISLSAAVFDCGDQNDERVNSCTPAAHNSCENPVETCGNQ